MMNPRQKNHGNSVRTPFADKKNSSRYEKIIDIDATGCGKTFNYT